MKKSFLICILFIQSYFGFSQFNVGSTLNEAKTEISGYYTGIEISEEYLEEIESITLRYTLLESEILDYFKNNICYLEVIIPQKTSAYNEWIKMFNEVLQKDGENKWISNRDGKNTIFECSYWKKKDINIFRIYQIE